MPRHTDYSHRLDRSAAPSLRNWQKTGGPLVDGRKSDAAVDMGWGRILFGHTYADSQALREALRQEAPDRRDISLYLRDPHVLLSLAPDELFLDPSHTYRLRSHDYRAAPEPPQAFQIRRIASLDDAEAMNRIYRTRHMASCDPAFLLDRHATRLRTYLVAEDRASRAVIGTITGVDHLEAFGDPENGASFWCLAVDPQAQAPGVGEALVRRIVEHYFARGRSYVDLSVMHDNREAIELYEKLGFQRIPAFCVKRKNAFNAPLFMAAAPEAELNVYARIIVDEARRRGIGVDVLDAAHGYFRLRAGGRAVVCRESLCELTSAIAMSRCDDKRVTHRLLTEGGLRMPHQQSAGDPRADRAFLERWQRLVVKPARGEQGRGISVDVRSPEALAVAVESAARHCPEVILEEMVAGEDLRIIVIDDRVVAAAVRRPPEVVGTGRHSVQALIEKYNRRRLAATDGESRVPLDVETERCLAQEGLGLETVPPAGDTVRVRKTANLHTGGTIHDVTDDLHPALVDAAVTAARILDIPVVGLDFMVTSPDSAQYAIIEANERPGLANHEPQPTAERFVDFLFPRTAA